ncbi:hypothetical protein GW17_00056272 [Ensete ventricosum]|nr:hypothetical protein GW17_00056272 [Ensete ventricosum]
MNQGLPYRAVRPRTGRYVPVRQLIGTWTAHYQAVLPKSKSTIGGRNKKKEKKREEEKEKRRKIPRALLFTDSPRGPSPAGGRFISLKDRGDGVPEQKLRAHLGSFGVTGNLALQPMYTLSGGQKSRVAFAKITFKKPHIILLDEPSNHLVSHDEHLISGSVGELWVVSEGRVAPFSGTFQDYKKKLKSSGI